MTAPPELSVVLPVYNGASTIDAQLGALASQRDAPDWELIVVDNGSTDSTRDRVEMWRSAIPQLRIVEARERSGVSYARNVGICSSRARAWVLCDADDVVSLGWVRAMARALQQHDFVTGPVDQSTLNSSRASLRPNTITRSVTVSAGYLPYAVGCNVGASKEVFERVGGFDETFRAGGDDVAFSWEVILAGTDLHFVPDAEVAYRHRDNLKQSWRQVHMYARALPHLYRNFRTRGMPRRPIAPELKRWAWLISRVPGLVFPGNTDLRHSWLRQSARLTGTLRGAVEARVFYL